VLRVRPRVLIVDDHALMREHAAQALEGEFMLVGRCSNIAALMAQWESAQPQAVVLDISLTDGTGFEAAVRLRAAGCAAPIVFLSVHESPEFIRAAWAAGATGYVAKRDLHRDLTTAVRAALCGRRYVSVSIQS
jgi:DNA-binding NarL/FixJ family response regulator